MGIKTAKEFDAEGACLTCKEIENAEFALEALNSGIDICVIPCPNSSEICCAKNWIAGKLSNRAVWSQIPPLGGYVRLWSANPSAKVVAMLQRHFGEKLTVV